MADQLNQVLVIDARDPVQRAAMHAVWGFSDAEKREHHIRNVRFRLAQARREAAMFGGDALHIELTGAIPAKCPAYLVDRIRGLEVELAAITAPVSEDIEAELATIAMEAA